MRAKQQCDSLFKMINTLILYTLNSINPHAIDIGYCHRIDAIESFDSWNKWRTPAESCYVIIIRPLEMAVLFRQSRFHLHYFAKFHGMMMPSQHKITINDIMIFTTYDIHRKTFSAWKRSIQLVLQTYLVCIKISKILSISTLYREIRRKNYISQIKKDIYKYIKCDRW